MLVTRAEVCAFISAPVMELGLVAVSSNIPVNSKAVRTLIQSFIFIVEILSEPECYLDSRNRQNSDSEGARTFDVYESQKLE